MRDLLKKSQPNPKEAILAIIFAFGITFVVAAFDVTVHDIFVLPDVEENGLEAGIPYWSALVGIVLFFGVLLLFFRLVAGKLAGAKTNAMLIFISFMWFFSAVILFYTGWLDFFYYIIKGEAIPETLHWLNFNGIFVILQQLGNDPDMVEKGDLYVSMLIGLVSLIGMWILITHHHRKKNLKKLGLI